MAIVNGKKVLAVVQTEAIVADEASEVSYSGVVEGATNVKEALDLLGNTKAGRNELEEVKNTIVDDNLFYHEENINVVDNVSTNAWQKASRTFTNMVVGETYTINVDEVIGRTDITNSCLYVFFYNGSTKLSETASKGGVYNNVSLQITIPENCDRVVIDFSANGGTQTSVNVNFNNINIYKGFLAEPSLKLQANIKLNEKSVEPNNTTFIENNKIFKVENIIFENNTTNMFDTSLLEMGTYTLEIKGAIASSISSNSGWTIGIYGTTEGKTISVCTISGNEYNNGVFKKTSTTTIPLIKPHIYVSVWGDASIVNLSAKEVSFYKGLQGELVLSDEIVIPKKIDEYEKYSLPILYLEGDISTMTKDNAVELTYKYGSLSGVCTCKWQGTSSIAYPKKNYTIKFDNEFEAKEGWGSQKKYCMKANYIDPSHTRNVGSAKIWGEMIKTRPNAPTELTSLVNGGAVDGFFIQIVINGVWQGVYTFNIPKDGWLMGMGDQTKKQAIICAEGANDEENLNRIKFFTAPQVNETDFAEEYRSDAWTKEEMVASLATLQSALMGAYNSSDEFKTAVSPHLDIDSVIDYMIYAQLAVHHDGLTKNFLLATLNGTKWFISLYDADSTFGLHWDGKTFGKYYLDADLIMHNWETDNRLFAKVYEYCKAEIKARFLELTKRTHYANGALSVGYVMGTLLTFAGGLPLALKIKDNELWGNIPMTDTNNVNQIIMFYHLKLEKTTNWINTL